MIPESLITGRLLPGVTTQQRMTAIDVYAYLDLRQGSGGWPVKGFRTVAKAIGVQERAVSKAAKVLADLGLIELTVTSPVATSAVMKIIHNPARGIVNPHVELGPTPKRYRHDPVPYPASSAVRASRKAVQRLHEPYPTPDAQDAAGSRSMRSEWFDAGTRDALAEMVSGGARCKDCLGFVASHRESGVDQREYCDCTFGVTNAANEATPLFPLSGSQ